MADRPPFRMHNWIDAELLGIEEDEASSSKAVDHRRPLNSIDNTLHEGDAFHPTSTTSLPSNSSSDQGLKDQNMLPSGALVALTGVRGGYIPSGGRGVASGVDEDFLARIDPRLRPAYGNSTARATSPTERTTPFNFVQPSDVQSQPHIGSIFPFNNEERLRLQRVAQRGFQENIAQKLVPQIRRSLEPQSHGQGGLSLQTMSDAVLHDQWSNRQQPTLPPLLSVPPEDSPPAMAAVEGPAHLRKRKRRAARKTTFLATASNAPASAGTGPSRVAEGEQQLRSRKRRDVETAAPSPPMRRGDNGKRPDRSPKPRIFKCPDESCALDYEDKSSLIRHLRCHQGLGPLYGCPNPHCNHPFFNNKCSFHRHLNKKLDKACLHAAQEVLGLPETELIPLDRLQEFYPPLTA